MVLAFCFHQHSETLETQCCNDLAPSKLYRSVNGMFETEVNLPFAHLHHHKALYISVTEMVDNTLGSCKCLYLHAHASTQYLHSAEPLGALCSHVYIS